MLRCALLLFASVVSIQAQQNQCITCHPAETKLHNQTRMAHAMIPALQSAFAQHVSDRPLHEAEGGFEYHYNPTEIGLEVTAEHGDRSAIGVIEWVLGAGAQGQTPMIRVHKSLFESRVSYFTTLNQFGITVDQSPGASPNPETALGLKENKHDAAACLECHSTGITKDLEPLVPGVQCERCHEGANEHAADVKQPVTNPGKMNARQQVEFCGACHRNKPPVDDTQIENVRFQPLRLMKSRCFASGQLACLTCHPAHRDAVRNNRAFYNEKCATCHASQATFQHTDERRGGDCVGCHMPLVQLHPGLKFTDHYIRVRKENDPVNAFLAEQKTD